MAGKALALVGENGNGTPATRYDLRQLEKLFDTKLAPVYDKLDEHGSDIRDLRDALVADQAVKNALKEQHAQGAERSQRNWSILSSKATVISVALILFSIVLSLIFTTHRVWF